MKCPFFEFCAGPLPCISVGEFFWNSWNFFESTVFFCVLFVIGNVSVCRGCVLFASTDKCIRSCCIPTLVFWVERIVGLVEVLPHPHVSLFGTLQFCVLFCYSRSTFLGILEGVFCPIVELSVPFCLVCPCPKTFGWWGAVGVWVLNADFEITIGGNPWFHPLRRPFFQLY